MGIFHKLATSLVKTLPPEAAHKTALRALALGLGPKYACDHDILKTELAGLSLPNPIGLAAGFDKDAQVPDAMLAAGFGFVEAGSVTPLPQAGNPKPRLFRLTQDKAVINRMGFNNNGMEVLAKIHIIHAYACRIEVDSQARQKDAVPACHIIIIGYHGGKV